MPKRRAKGPAPKPPRKFGAVKSKVRKTVTTRTKTTKRPK